MSAGSGPAHPAQFTCVKALGTEEEPRSSSLPLHANTAPVVGQVTSTPRSGSQRGSD